MASPTDSKSCLQVKVDPKKQEYLRQLLNISSICFTDTAYIQMLQCDITNPLMKLIMDVNHEKRDTTNICIDTIRRLEIDSESKRKQMEDNDSSDTDEFIRKVKRQKNSNEFVSTTRTYH